MQRPEGTLFLETRDAEAFWMQSNIVLALLLLWQCLSYLVCFELVSWLGTDSLMNVLTVATIFKTMANDEPFMVLEGLSTDEERALGYLGKNFCEIV